MSNTILLVDDNPVQAATRQAILVYSGNTVIVATSACHALALFDNLDLARNVGLVITDHLMPKMNGPQFVVELRKRFPTLPVLVLSGMPDAEIEYSGINVVYRLKPIAPEELIQVTRALCEDTLGRTA
jgi:DNA-binding response OmpR family regulator